MVDGRGVSVKSFSQYLLELAEPRKPLWVFDFDDTLVVDSATVDVLDKNTGEVLRSLTSDEFKSYTLKDGEEFDFISHSRKPVNAKPIPAVLKIMRQVLSRDGRAVVLTGRKFSHAVRKYLREIGIDIEVIAIGGKSGGTHAGIARAKAQWIEGEIDKGYNDIEVFDDNALNLEYINRLKEKSRVRIRTKLVKYKPK